jgi:hypothetical protein
MIRWCIVRFSFLMLLVGIVSCGGPSEAEIQATVAAGMQATAQAGAAQSTAVAAAVSATQAAAPMTEAAYKAASQAQAENITNGLAGFSELMHAADKKLPSWRSKLADQMTMIHDANKVLIAMVPPPGMRAIHTVLLSGTADCDSAAKLIPLSLDGDTKALDKASALLQSCGDTMLVVATKLQAYEISQ